MCVACSKSTEHLICTHWVACNDHVKNKKAQYKLLICSKCGTEHSTCRKCQGRGTSNATTFRTHIWTENAARTNRSSLKCDVCRQRYVRCNYCKVRGRIAIYLLVYPPRYLQQIQPLASIVFAGFIQTVSREKSAPYERKLQIL